MKQMTLNEKVRIFRWSLTIVLCIIIFTIEKYHAYEMVSNFITYDNGFISRGLAGSLLWSILPHKYYTTAWSILYKSCTCAFLIYFNIKCDKLLYKYENNSNAQKYLHILMLAPIGTYFLFFEYTFRLDMIAIIFAAIMYETINTKKINIYIKTIICCILSILCILIHQGVLFTIMPFITLMLWQYRNKIITIIYLTCIGCAFSICQFFGKIEFDIIYNDILTKMTNTDWPQIFNDTADMTIREVLYLEYASSIFDHNELLRTTPFSALNIFALLLILLTSIPFLTILWKHVLNNLLNKYELTFLILSQFVLNLMTIDLVRWYNLFIMNAIIFYINNHKQKDIISNWPDMTIKQYNIATKYLIIVTIFTTLYGIIY